MFTYTNCALTGVRRHRGNWDAMLQDQRLCFHKSRTPHALAEQWKEEQSKLLGVPPPEVTPKQVRHDNSPFLSGEDGLAPPRSRGQATVIEGSAGKKLTTSHREEIAEKILPSTDTRGHFGASSLALKDTRNLQDHHHRRRDLKLVHGHEAGQEFSLNQTPGMAFGEHDRKHVLESLRAVDLSSRRFSMHTGFPAKDGSDHQHRGHEPSSALGLVNSVRSQVGNAVAWEAGNTSRSAISMDSSQTVDLDTWDAQRSGRRIDAGKEMAMRPSHQSQKPKLPSSFLQSLSFNPDLIEKHTQEARDSHTLPFLPRGSSSSSGMGSLNAAGSSVTGVFANKSLIQHMQADGLLSTKGSHHDPRSSISSSFAALDKRRLKLGSSSKNSDPNVSNNEASQSLPHWLREAFKPDPPQPPKAATLSPMITAVAQATAFLYKDFEPFLPPFVHPGPLPPRPKRAPHKKKGPPAVIESRPGEMNENSQVAAELLPGLNAPNLLTGLEVTSSVVPTIPTSLQQFASSLKSGISAGGGQQQSGNISPFSKRLIDFSALPSVDPPPQQQALYSKPSALEELMALKNLSSVPPFAPPLNESLERSLFAQSSSASAVLDTTTTSSLGLNVSVLGGKGDHHHHVGARQGHHHQSSTSILTNKPPHVKAEGDIPHVHFAKEGRGRKQKDSSFSYTVQRSGSDGSTDPSSQRMMIHHDGGGSEQQQLPSWLKPPVRVGAPRAREAPPSEKKVVTSYEDNQSSSETESDPRIHGKAGKVHDFDDVSSDETISDDRTQ